ncbi:MAG: anhydro-N-acetylmuramic acid kinase [Alphaproteobacteria bacterium]|nr:anhydro-N-acetylmuramic acid kinase [Alphaproteobacteria bacterium]
MSGTSLDGVDLAWIETDGERLLRTGPALTVPYDEATRAAVRAVFGHRERCEATDAAEIAVTRAHIDAVARWRALHDAAFAVDLVGFHGQTITHRPEERFTWQLGDGAGLARTLNLPVVFDLRAADVAAGGQGAPLVPVFHAALVADEPRPVAVLNVGGVANVTWVGSGGGLLAFDTGPGNAPIDDWCRSRAGTAFDLDGALAASGQIDSRRLERFCENRYFARRPPKSLDRGDFGSAWVEGLGAADGAATLTRATARAAALASRHFPAPVTRWIVCGGGARNPVLMKDLAGETGDEVVAASARGWDGDALEAQAFAFLAVRSVRGLPLSFPTTTGVPGPMCGGRLALPPGS